MMRYGWLVASDVISFAFLLGVYLTTMFESVHSNVRESMRYVVEEESCFFPVLLSLSGDHPQVMVGYCLFLWRWRLNLRKKKVPRRRRWMYG